MNTYVLLSKEQKTGFIGQYISDILDIGWYQYNFANQKSIGQKIGRILEKSLIFR